MRIPQEELEKKITVPKTLSVLANITGTKPLKARLTNPTVKIAKEVLDGLNKTSRAYSVLMEEIKSQITEKEINPGYEEVTLKLPGMDEVVIGLDNLSEIVSGMVFPEPPKSVEVSNLKDYPEFPKFPEFPKTIQVTNFPKPQKFPSSISVNNFPEGLNLDPVISALQENRDSLIKGLENLQGVFKGEETLGIHILDSEGNIMSDFSPRVTVSGGSGGSEGGTPRNIISGSTTVATAGTATQLDNSASSAKRIDVQAPKSNTGTIYVGAGTVVAAAGSEKGIGLEPGDVYAFEMTAPDSIYLDSTVDGEGLTWNIFS